MVSHWPQSQYIDSRDTDEEKKLTVSSFLWIFPPPPFCTHQRRMVSWGSFRQPLPLLLFLPSPPCRKAGWLGGLLLAEVLRAYVVLADGWLMDSVEFFQWKFPTIWYWSRSLEWSFRHFFTRLIKDFLFLSGNCISCGVFLIQVLHQSAVQGRFVVLLERFTSRDGVSYSVLLSPPGLLEK